MMCQTCGCAIGTENTSAKHSSIATDAGATRESVQVLRDMLQVNDEQARHNRSSIDAAGVLSINLMSSPGAGKTSLLEATRARLDRKIRFGVIVGDLETEKDANRLREWGIPALQITTGNACHLDAQMLHRALHEFDLANIDILFIENVGNLVCPASFDLGHHLNVTLLSVPEGDDKPAKYPVMFRAADLVLLSKSDLLPLMPEFDSQTAISALQDLANPSSILPVSVRTADGLDYWIKWLEESRATHAERFETAEPGRQDVASTAHGRSARAYPPTD